MKELPDEIVHREAGNGFQVYWAEHVKAREHVKLEMNINIIFN